MDTNKFGIFFGLFFASIPLVNPSRTFLSYHFHNNQHFRIELCHVRLYRENANALSHRLLLLKLDKQISGTIYRPYLAANEAYHLEGMGFHVGGGGVL